MNEELSTVSIWAIAFGGIAAGVLFIVIARAFGVRAVRRIGCKACLGGAGEGPYYCGQGTEHPNFFDDGRSLYLGSRICVECGMEYFDSKKGPRQSPNWTRRKP